MQAPDSNGPRQTTVVIPAHNEERVLGRLLAELIGPGESWLRVVVVANGCLDSTADVARTVMGVEVLELPEGNKQRAMRAGALRASAGPVVFVDADVVISGSHVCRLVAALAELGVLAAAPRRTLNLVGASAIVRSYYRVWSELPMVVSGLFGRGVIALSADGYARVAALPMFLSDDLALSESFSPKERLIVESSEVQVRGPRRFGDLARRRRRIVAGVREFDDAVPGRERTSLRSLSALARRTPRRIPDILVFLGVTIVARLMALRDAKSPSARWWRDESSREG